MTTQISLTDEEKNIISNILKSHNVDIIYEERTIETDIGLVNETIFNNVSINISEADHEQWYIQVD